MTRNDDDPRHQETFDKLREVRAEALMHARLARQLAAERRVLIQGLISEGFSQADRAGRGQRNMSEALGAMSSFISAGRPSGCPWWPDPCVSATCATNPG